MRAGLPATTIWRRAAVLVAAVLLPFAVMGQGAFIPGPLDATTVSVSGTAVVAVYGPANGCNISSASIDLIIDPVNTAGTSASGTAQLQTHGNSPYQCGPIAAGVKVTVNISGGGTGSWQGTKW